MANEPSTSKGTGGPSRGGGRKFNPYNRRGNNRNPGPRQKPTSLLIPTSNAGGNNLNSDDGLMTTSVHPEPEPLISFMMDTLPGQYPGWMLYFPKDSKLKMKYN